MEFFQSRASTGRRAGIAGTGIDIGNFIATFKGLGENYDKLKETYRWIADQQIRLALSYFAIYSDEIDEKITRNEDITQEQVIKRFPFLSKPAGKK